MANPFELVTDRRGRTVEFIPAGHEGEAISPESIGEFLDGGERITYKGVEYDLTSNGSLIYPEVNVGGLATLGAGVRITRGTEFVVKEAEKGVVVHERALVDGAKIWEAVEIGDHAVIRSASIKSGAKVGAYSRIGVGVRLSPGVLVEASVVIDDGSSIGSSARIERSTKLGFKTSVAPGQTIGHHSRIGMMRGDRGIGSLNRGGVTISAGKDIPPKTYI